MVSLSWFFFTVMVLLGGDEIAMVRVNRIGSFFMIEVLRLNKSYTYQRSYVQ